MPPPILVGQPIDLPPQVKIKQNLVRDHMLPLYYVHTGKNRYLQENAHCGTKALSALGTLHDAPSRQIRSMHLCCNGTFNSNLLFTLVVN